MRVMNICSNKSFQQLICYCYELLLLASLMCGFFLGCEYQLLEANLGITLIIFQLALVGALIIYLAGAKSKIKSLNLKLQKNNLYDLLSKKDMAVLRGKLSLGSKVYIVIFILVSLSYFLYQNNWKDFDSINYFCIVIIYLVIHAGLEMWRTGNSIELKLKKWNQANQGGRLNLPS